MSIVDCRLHTPSFVREDARGTFIEVVNSGPWETVITGTMNTGAVMGNHYHKKTRMYFYLMDGAASVDLVDVVSRSQQSCELAPRQGFFLEANEAHAIRFRRPSSFVLLKSRCYSEDDPDTYPYVISAPQAKAMNQPIV